MQNFINRNLEAKEERINKLHSEGDQLLASEHPGRNSIEVLVPWGGGCLLQGDLRAASAVGRLDPGSQPPQGGGVLHPASVCLSLMLSSLPPSDPISSRSHPLPRPAIAPGPLSPGGTSSFPGLVSQTTAASVA